MEKLPDHWRESNILPVHKKGNKIGYGNYRGISLLSTAYKSVSNILISKLSPYIDKIIGNHRAFRRNRVTIDQNVCIPQILEKNESTYESVH
jgi:hypothetical protein